MTRIKVNCPDCHTESKIPAQNLTVWSSGLVLGYRYDCPNCAEIVARGCTLNVFGTLSLAGCPYQHIPKPAEVDEPRRSDPISNDELMDFFIDVHGDVALAAERELSA